MSDLPRDPAFDNTIALLREGYRFLPDRFRRLDSDVFRTRLMLQPVVCVQGEEAARLLYEPGRFTRRAALPPTTLMSLQDFGSVQRLDGDAHLWRKRMFLSLMSRARVRALGDGFEALWRARMEDWARRETVALFPEVTDLICRAVCDWAGAPLDEAEAQRRAREFGAMIDGAGAVGPRNWRGLMLRARTERWGRALIERVRTGAVAAPKGCPLQVIAFHRDQAGELLPAKIAAVELLNVLRPTVAVDRFIVYAALALHEHPGWRERLASAPDAVVLAFAQEVRRFYPFFPAVGGRAREAFEWRGRRFAKGAWFLLDVYGTNRDPRAWSQPEAFRPERFLEAEASAYNFTPQGAGDPASGHRCPGEPITLELMGRALRLLTREMTYEVPPQDLTVDLGRMPAGPASGFMLGRTRPCAPAERDPS